MASVLANIAKMSVTGTPGTGDITLNAAVTGWITFATAGITNGLVVSYNASDGVNQETGTATYSSSGPKLTGRTLTLSTTGSLISLTSNAVITLSTRAEDINDKASLTTTGQSFSGGLHLTSYNYATGNITIDCGLGPSQYVTGNSSAWSITAPSADGSCLLMVINPASSVNIPTFSGFTTGSNTGDPLTSTANSKFTLSIWRINGTSSYVVKALQ